MALTAHLDVPHNIDVTVASWQRISRDPESDSAAGNCGWSNCCQSLGFGVILCCKTAVVKLKCCHAAR